MATASQQQLLEIIDVADVSVRVASQLRMAKKKLPIRDPDAIQRAQEFLTAAIEGGRFISTGKADNFHSTLRPLNWAADVRFQSQSAQKPAENPLEEYDTLVVFLQNVLETLQALESADVSNGNTDNAIGFFQRLGEILGTRADQIMRHTSTVFSPSSLMVG
jgi:hypothetical protein